MRAGSGGAVNEPGGSVGGELGGSVDGRGGKVDGRVDDEVEAEVDDELGARVDGRVDDEVAAELDGRVADEVEAEAEVEIVGEVDDEVVGEVDDEVDDEVAAEGDSDDQRDDEVAAEFVDGLTGEVVVVAGRVGEVPAACETTAEPSRSSSRWMGPATAPQDNPRRPARAAHAVQRATHRRCRRAHDHAGRSRPTCPWPWGQGPERGSCPGSPGRRAWRRRRRWRPRGRGTGRRCPA